MKREELKQELKLLLKQFIEHLNQNAKDYFNGEIDEIVDKHLPLIIEEEKDE